MNIIKLSKSNIDNILSQHALILIEFGAKWCAPCKNYAKVLTEVSKEYPDFVFTTVDIDEEKEIANEFQLQSVPATLILRNKTLVFAETGALSANDLRNLLNQALSL